MRIKIECETFTAETSDLETAKVLITMASPKPRVSVRVTLKPGLGAKKIYAIRCVCEHTGATLGQAKEMVEAGCFSAVLLPNRSSQDLARALSQEADYNVELESV
jgi:ribosomal protein L7/L12